jgi:hypothetical protein
LAFRSTTPQEGWEQALLELPKEGRNSAACTVTCSLTSENIFQVSHDTMSSHKYHNKCFKNENHVGGCE